MEEKIYELIDKARKTAAGARKTASGAAYYAGKKAEDLAEKAKLNVKILEKQSEVRDAMRELGEILYATHIGSPGDSDILLEKLQAVDAMKAEIAQMEIAAGKAERVRTCRKCGTEAKTGDRFCRSCGEKL